MPGLRPTLLALSVLLVAPLIYGQATESSINKQLKSLRAVPTAERPAATIKINVAAGAGGRRPML